MYSKKNKKLTKKVAARLTFKGSYGFKFSVLLSNSRAKCVYGAGRWWHLAGTGTPGRETSNLRKLQGRILAGHAQAPKSAAGNRSCPIGSWRLAAGTVAASGKKSQTPAVSRCILKQHILTLTEKCIKKALKPINNKGFRAFLFFGRMYDYTFSFVSETICLISSKVRYFWSNCVPMQASVHLSTSL